MTVSVFYSKFVLMSDDDKNTKSKFAKTIAFSAIEDNNQLYSKERSVKILYLRIIVYFVSMNDESE